MIYKNLCLFVILFFTNYCYSQIILGTITNENGDIIPTANVLIKENKEGNSLKGFAIAKNGFYKIDLKNSLKKFHVEVSSSGYKTISKTIEKPLEKNTLNFTLEKQKIKAIKEVFIKKEKFSVKKDTIVYNVSSYKDITDSKVQDVLKRMPGITVNDKTGAIKYNNKPVETVKLEGDDLFGTNYTVGTKNINVDIVQKVEVLQHYSKNELLKGIEHSDKVALNLKLKKGKIDLSGSIDWANGYDANSNQLHLINTSIVQVAKKYKSFATLSYNNIGINNSPYDNFSNSQSIAQQVNNDYSAQKIITEMSFDGSLGEDRMNRNNQLFSSYNMVFKPSRRISTRINLSYLQDKIYQDIYHITELLNENYTLSDELNSKKKPHLYKIEMYTKGHLSKRTLLEYTLSAFNKNTSQSHSIIQNNTAKYNVNTSTKNNFIRQSLNLTHKLSPKSALQINTNYSYNNLPQETISNPFILVNQNEYFEKQLSNFKKQVLDFQVVFLSKFKNKKYLLSIGNVNEVNDYSSGISGESNQINSTDYKNLFKNKKRTFYSTGQINFTFNKLLIQPSFNLIYLSQNHDDKLNILKKNNLLIEPKISLKYSVNNKSQFSGVIEYKQSPFREDKLIMNPVFINNRNSINSQPTLEIQKKLNTSFNYLYNDLYRQFRLNIGVYHNVKKGNYFSDYTISPYITHSRFFYNSKKQITSGINFSVDKYLSFLESTFKFDSSASKSTFYNIINNSDFRKVKTQSQTNSIYWKSSFDGKVNFENRATYHTNSTKIETLGQKNTLNSFNNSFKIIIKPYKKIYIISNTEYLIPDTSIKEDYIFTDIELRYRLDKKWNFAALAKNILNKKSMNDTDINDYSISTTNLLIIPRYFIMNISYSF